MKNLFFYACFILIGVSSSAFARTSTDADLTQFGREMREETRQFGRELRGESNGVPKNSRSGKKKNRNSFEPKIGGQYYLFGTMSQSYLVTIIEARDRGEYAFRWDNGPFQGNYALNAHPRNLAMTSGCTSEGFCVGDRVIVPSRRSMMAEIVGVAFDGQMVLRALSGPWIGQTGGSWTSQDVLRVN